MPITRKFTLNLDVKEGADDRTLVWYGGEVVSMGGYLKRGRDAVTTEETGCLAKFQVWSGTATGTLFVDEDGTFDNSNGAFTFPDWDPTKTNLTAGTYNGALRIYDATGLVELVVAWVGQLSVPTNLPAVSGVPLVGGVNVLKIATADDMDAGAIAAGKYIQVGVDGVTHEYVDAPSGGGVAGGLVLVPEMFQFDVAEAGLMGWVPDTLDQIDWYGSGASLKSASGSTQTGYLRANLRAPAWTEWNEFRAMVIQFWETQGTPQSGITLTVYGYRRQGIISSDRVHTGANGATVLADSTQTYEVDELVGETLVNAETFASEVITANTAGGSITTSGGITWTAGDRYYIRPTLIVSSAVASTPSWNDIPQEFVLDRADLTSTKVFEYYHLKLAFTSANNHYTVFQQLELNGA